MADSEWRWNGLISGTQKIKNLRHEDKEVDF